MVAIRGPVGRRPDQAGLNASGVIFDELHAQPNRDLWDVLKNGFVPLQMWGVPLHGLAWPPQGEFSWRVRFLPAALSRYTRRGPTRSCPTFSEVVDRQLHGATATPLVGSTCTA